MQAYKDDDGMKQPVTGIGMYLMTRHVANDHPKMRRQIRR